jgi:hypothetical protein
MSALNVLVTNDAVHLFTDAGLYDPETGRLDRIGSKVIPILGGMNAVIGATGFSWVALLVAGAMSQRQPVAGVHAQALTTFVSPQVTGFEFDKSDPAAYGSRSCVSSVRLGSARAGSNRRRPLPRRWALSAHAHHARRDHHAGARALAG